MTPEDEVTLTEVAEISDEEKAASKDKKEKAAMIKKNRLFAAIKEYLDELMNRKFIVKYELKKYKRPTENNLCGYDGISIVFIGKKKRIWMEMQHFCLTATSYMRSKENTDKRIFIRFCRHIMRF